MGVKVGIWVTNQNCHYKYEIKKMNFYINGENQVRAEQINIGRFWIPCISELCLLHAIPSSKKTNKFK